MGWHIGNPAFPAAPNKGVQRTGDSIVFFRSYISRLSPAADARRSASMSWDRSKGGITARFALANPSGLTQDVLRMAYLSIREEEKMAADVFSHLDALPAASIQTIAERLEIRADIDDFAQMRTKYFEALALPDDATLLELGGGTGVVGRAYVTRPGFAGTYVVSDLSETLIAFGKAKALEQGLSDLMDFRVVDAISGDGVPHTEFDAVILHTILSHVPDPEGVMRTAVKALRLGGLIAAFDADYASLQIVSGISELDQKAESALKNHAVAQTTIMRRMPQVASRLGLKLRETQPHFLAEVGESSFFIGIARALTGIVVSQGGLRADDGEAWLSALEQSISQDEFFAMCPYFTYIYEKPAA